MTRESETPSAVSTKESLPATGSGPEKKAPPFPAPSQQENIFHTGHGVYEAETESARSTPPAGKPRQSASCPAAAFPPAKTEK